MHSMIRLAAAALTLGLAAGAARLPAQATAGGGSGSSGERTEVRLRALQRVDEPELARELAHHQAVRMQLVARVEALAARLQNDATLGTTERRRLQSELEASVRQLTATHARVGLDVGSRIMLERQAGVASGEVRRVLGETQRLLTSAARTGHVGITLSPTNNHVRVKDSGELFVRYFEYPTILSVEPGSPAERAGLQRGDLVLAYNESDVRRELPMHEILRAGHQVKIRVRRDGRDREVGLTVANAPENVLGRRTDFLVPSTVEPQSFGFLPGVRTPSARARSMSPRRSEGSVVVYTQPGAGRAATFQFDLTRGIAGAELSAITPGLASTLGVKKGLLVMSVAPRSAAAIAGLRDGDIVIKANGREVHDIATLSRVMREHDASREVTLETLRQKKKQTVRLSW